MQHFGGDGNLGAQPAPPQALGPVQPAGGPPYGGGRGPQAILDRLTAC